MLHRMVSPLSPCTTTQRPTSIISHLAAIDRRITLRAQRSTATNTPSIRTHNNDNLVVPSCADPCFRPRCSSTRHSAEPCRHEDAILHAAAAAHAPPGPHLLGDIPQQRDHIVVHLPLLRVSQDLVCAVGPLELIRRLCCRLRVSLLVGVVFGRELPVGLLQFIICSRVAHSEDLIVVVLCCQHRRRWHRLLLTGSTRRRRRRRTSGWRRWRRQVGRWWWRGRHTASPGQRSA